MAPERVHDKSFALMDAISEHPERAVKLDVYSFGIILYELRERKIPLEGENNSVILERARMGTVLPDSSYCDDYEDLMRRCASPNSPDRPFFEDALADLEEMYALERRENNFDRELLEQSASIDAGASEHEAVCGTPEQEGLAVETESIPRSSTPHRRERRLSSRSQWTSEESTSSLSEPAEESAELLDSKKNATLPLLFSSGPMSGMCSPVLPAARERSKTDPAKRTRRPFTSPDKSFEKAVESSSVPPRLDSCQKHSSEPFPEVQRVPKLRDSKSEPSFPVVAARPKEQRRRSDEQLLTAELPLDAATIAAMPSLLQAASPLSSIREQQDVCYPSLHEIDSVNTWDELHRIRDQFFSDDSVFYSAKEMKEMKRLLKERIEEKQLCCPLNLIADIVKCDVGCVMDKREKFISLLNKINQSLPNFHPEEMENEEIDNFDRVTESVSEDVPTILLLGRTSAGVTSILNSLIGQEILPRDLGSTAPACEIEYGKERQFKIVTLNDKGYETVVDQKTFRDPNAIRMLKDHVKAMSGAVNTFTSATSQYAKKYGNPSKCRVVIQWPSLILKFVKFVDAPNPIGYAACHPSVSGFIFVLDSLGLTSHEEVVEQARVLHTSVSVRETHCPLPFFSLFILNKWDQFQLHCQDEDSTRKYLDSVCRGIAEFAPSFCARELVTFSAREACFCLQCKNQITDCLYQLCQAIGDAFNKWFESFLLRKLSRPCRLLLGLKRSQETDLKKQTFTMHGEACIRRLPSVITNKIALASKAIIESKYLFKDESALDWSHLSEQEAAARDEEDLEQMVKLRLSRTIIESPEFRSFYRWIESETLWLSQFADILERLQAQPLTESHYCQAASVLFNSVEVAVRESPAATTILSGFFRALQHASFKQEFDEAYKFVVRDCNEPLVLNKILSNVVTETIVPAAAILNGQLNGPKVDAQKTDRHVTKTTREALDATKLLMNETAMLMLSNSAASEFSDESFSQSDGTFSHLGEQSSLNQEVLHFFGGCGCKRTDLLKSNATELLESIFLCRGLENEHVLQFLGSAYLCSSSSPSLGLVFEWNGCGTLASEIFESSSFSCLNKPERFSQTQHFATQLLQAMSYLHARNVILQALNPNDIMVTADGNIKVTPVVELPNINSIPLHTSVPYLAPEVVRQSPVTTSADVFSVGVILWEIWFRQRVYIFSSVYNLDSETFRRKARLGHCLPAVDFGHVRLNDGGNGDDDDGAAPSSLSSISIDSPADFYPIDRSLLNRKLRKFEDLVKMCWSLIGKHRPSSEDALRTILSL